MATLGFQESFPCTRTFLPFTCCVYKASSLTLQLGLGYYVLGLKVTGRQTIMLLTVYVESARDLIS